MKSKLPLDQCVGITETADAALYVSEWSRSLKQIGAGILITKCPNKKFIQEVLNNKDKIVVHFTVTGYAKTLLEPNTPSVKIVFDKIHTLIKEGFNSSQIVIRIDPVIPTPKGIKVFESVIKDLNKLNENLINEGFGAIMRVRYSFIDMYKHAINRFKALGLNNPYCSDNFAPPQNMINNFMKILNKYNSYFLFESCAENTEHKLACVSVRDLEVLGLVNQIKLQSHAKQRSTCLCPANKTQLLTFKNESCPLKCAYCYWR